MGIRWHLICQISPKSKMQILNISKLTSENWWITYSLVLNFEMNSPGLLQSVDIWNTRADKMHFFITHCVNQAAVILNIPHLQTYMSHWFAFKLYFGAAILKRGLTVQLRIPTTHNFLDKKLKRAEITWVVPGNCLVSGLSFLNVKG